MSDHAAEAGTTAPERDRAGGGPGIACSTPRAGSTMFGPARPAGRRDRYDSAQEEGMLHVEAHGARIPALGLGTFRLDGSVARRMVGHALEIGYRHIDTAQMYGNEAEVGAAVASSGRAARRDLADHQDLARQLPRRRAAAGSRAERAPARHRARPAPAALAEPERAARRDRTRAERCQAARPCAAHRHQQLHGRADPGGAGAQRGAADRRSGRVPAVSQPGDACSRSCARTAWR